MKKRIIARVVSAAAAFAVILAASAQSAITPISVSATTTDELQKKIDANKALIDELDGKIKDLDSDIAESEEVQGYYYQKLLATQDRIDLLNNQIYEKEQEILAKEQEITDIETKIADTEKNIEDKEAEIALLEKTNDENVYRFGQIVRAMYITDSDDYLTVIAGSADFYDIFVRSEIMKNASEQNLKFMNDLLNDIHRLDEDRIQLGKDKEKLEFDKELLNTERDNLESERKELDESRKYNSDLSASYTNEYNIVSSKIANFESLQDDYRNQKKVSMAEIEKYEKQIDELIRLAQQQASNSVVYDEGEWRWPLDPQFHLITTYFGYDAWRNGNHGAIDVGNGGINGANIYAMKGGEVIIAKTSYTPGYDYGKYVVIDHGNGFQSLYAHCSDIYVSVGQMVNKGDVIAAVGSTGWSTGPHLHFEIRKDGSRVDPLNYVKVPQ